MPPHYSTQDSCLKVGSLSFLSASLSLWAQSSLMGLRRSWRTEAALAAGVSFSCSPCESPSEGCDPLFIQFLRGVVGQAMSPLELDSVNEGVPSVWVGVDPSTLCGGVHVRLRTVDGPRELMLTVSEARMVTTVAGERSTTDLGACCSELDLLRSAPAGCEERLSASFTMAAVSPSLNLNTEFFSGAGKSEP